MKEHFKVKDNSVFAFIAKKILRSEKAAIVIGKTIFLNGVKKETFLADQQWLQHELCHIRQFKQFGFFRFLILYLMESLKHGYHNNRFEVEARAAEKISK